MIFKELSKTIVDRCETYNGENADITSAAKELHTSLIANFEKIHAEII